MDLWVIERYLNLLERCFFALLFVWATTNRLYCFSSKKVLLLNQKSSLSSLLLETKTGLIYLKINSLSGIKNLSLAVWRPTCFYLNKELLRIFLFSVLLNTFLRFYIAGYLGSRTLLPVYKRSLCSSLNTPPVKQLTFNIMLALTCSWDGIPRKIVHVWIFGITSKCLITVFKWFNSTFDCGRWLTTAPKSGNTGIGHFEYLNASFPFPLTYVN